MKRRESFFVRHLWWMGLLLLDVYYVLSLPRWFSAKEAVLVNLLFIAIANVYAIATVVVHWRRDGRVPVRSQEFEALGAWLGYGAITVFWRLIFFS
jgi:lysylphosphatidylglycerol synthetase-like protein (DUF2156 family)